jgi:hypothetical protein
MDNVYKFETNLVALSESDDLREAKDEWIFVNYRIGDRDIRVKCVCGRNFWKEINVYCNELNGNTIHAGSECDRRFKDTQRGRGTKNEILRDFMALEKGIYENIFDYIAYSRDVLDRLCKHIESQIDAFNLVGLEKLLHGVGAIIAGLVSKNQYKGDLDRFIPMIQAAMATARVTEEATRVQREAQRMQREAERLAEEEAERLAEEEAERLAEEEAERLAKEKAERLAQEEQRKLAAIADMERRVEHARRLIAATAEKKRLLGIKEEEVVVAEEKWRSSDRSDPKAFNEAVEKWAEKQRIQRLLTKLS